MMKAPKLVRFTSPRLFVKGPLAEGLLLSLGLEQAHYLRHVIRCQEADTIRLFNGLDGEWLGQLTPFSKKGVAVEITEQTRKQTPLKPLFYAPALIKKTHLEYAFEKTTELGISAIHPIITERSQIREFNSERALTIVTESSEQSERLDRPEIRSPQLLTNFLKSEATYDQLIVAAEWGEAESVAPCFVRLKSEGITSPCFLTGPEGGFTQHELELFAHHPKTSCVRLGPRILRADTAGISVIASWQALVGDWVS